MYKNYHMYESAIDLLDSLKIKGYEEKCNCLS